METVDSIEYNDCKYAKEPSASKVEVQARNMKNHSLVVCVNYDSNEGRLSIEERSVRKTFFDCSEVYFVIHNSKFACRVNLAKADEEEKFLYIVFKKDEVIKLLESDYANNVMVENYKFHEWVDFFRKSKKQ